MLIEEALLKGFDVVDANTDAITVHIPDDRAEEFDKIMDWWCELTKMKLDKEYFYKVFQLSCNHYIAIKANDDGTPKYKDGEIQIKYKGTMEPFSGLLKGFEYPVVAIAVSNYFVHNIPIAKTIKEHTDIYDYCITVRMNAKYNAMHGDEALQKTNRYYAGVGPKAKFILKHSNEENSNASHLLKASKVIIFNKYYEAPMEEYNINYSFYIEEAEKIRRKIKPDQLSLF